MGFAVFLRRVLPERDLSEDHDFWKGQDDSQLSLSQSWHSEVFVHLLVEKQFLLVLIKDEDAGDR